MAGLIYVLPVHNEEPVLRKNVRRLLDHAKAAEASHVYLVENGSRDASWEICQALQREIEVERETNPSRPSLRAFRETSAGLGYAYHRGLVEALSAFGASSSHWALLSAADFPFGFTDVQAAHALLADAPSRMLMGSKAHPKSRADTGAKRRVMSMVYRMARRAIVGMRVGDSQGTVFLRLDLAADLVGHMLSRDFFYSTELCHHAERAGEHIVELPVVLEQAQRGSTVRPMKHSVDMATQLVRLRLRDLRG